MERIEDVTMKLKQYIEIEFEPIKDSPMLIELLLTGGESRIFWEYDKLLKEKYGEHEVVGLEKNDMWYKIKLKLEEQEKQNGI